eukprot:TRINITY_DN3850_c0_g1_i5.p1 TRINITY_DN3850_c0_g1~~TRINITY_DN3850_c0_g1_i5.p1  ORF type:complete len:755 (-),score=77.27 TRINITY_DN3850_c0_g1_i5:17-2092(-)
MSPSSKWIDRYVLAGNEWGIPVNSGPVYRNFSDVELIGNYIYGIHSDKISAFDPEFLNYWNDGPLVQNTNLVMFDHIFAEGTVTYLYNSSQIWEFQSGFFPVSFEFDIGGETVIRLNYQGNAALAVANSTSTLVWIFCAESNPCIKNTLLAVISLEHTVAKMKADSLLLYIIGLLDFSVFDLSTGEMIFHSISPPGEVMVDLDFLPGANSVLVATSSKIFRFKYDAATPNMTWEVLVSTADLSPASLVDIARASLTPERLYFSDSNWLVTVCLSSPAPGITTGGVTTGSIPTPAPIINFPCGGIGVQCANGNCVQSPSMCALGKCTVSPNLFRCSDESCVATPFSCPVLCTVGYLVCWDGSCHDESSQCPVFPGCPALHRRCSDGSCASYSESCEPQSTCPSNQKSCPDGSCVGDLSECDEFNGCHENQFQCLDGSCADDISGCFCDNPSEYKCVLGRCGAVCPDSPITSKPISMLYLDDSASGPRELKVFAENAAVSGKTLGSITIFPTEGTRPQYSVQVGGVADSVIRNATLPSDPVIISSVVKWELKGEASAIREDTVIELIIDESVPTEDVSKFCLAMLTRGEWKCVESELVVRRDSDGTFVRGPANGRGADYSVLFGSSSGTSSGTSSDPENRTVMIASITVVCLAIVIVASAFGAVVVIKRRRRLEEEKNLNVSLNSVDQSSSAY